MDIELTEEQSLLKESAERFMENEYDFEARQTLAASEDGFSRAHWKTYAELGWLAMPLPEEHGGLGGGAVEAAVLMEVFGRGLFLEPYLATVVLGAGLVAAAGSEAQKAAILPEVAAGDRLLAFAHGERQARFDLADIATRAEASGGGYAITGHKAVVWHGGAADTLVVSARTSGDARDPGGISLFLVDAKATGVDIRPYPTNDGQRAADVTFDGVEVGVDDRLGEDGDALPAIEAVVDGAKVALSAEAVGAMGSLVTITQDYLKTRKQFGVPLSTFQVLQHRLVEMFNEAQMSRALAFRAAAGLTASDAGGRRRAAAAAKAQAGRSGKLVGQQAVQLHGGMGMTHELPVGHYFKRISMIDAQFGNTDHNRALFAG